MTGKNHCSRNHLVCVNFFGRYCSGILVQVPRITTNGHTCTQKVLLVERRLLCMSSEPNAGRLCWIKTSCKTFEKLASDVESLSTCSVNTFKLHWKFIRPFLRPVLPRQKILATTFLKQFKHSAEWLCLELKLLLVQQVLCALSPRKKSAGMWS